jgi:bifunctional non-homologous end joining protein LigD
VARLTSKVSTPAHADGGEHRHVQSKERTMQTEQAALQFRQGSSDKVYHLQLENVEDIWSVQAQWGRRGSALQSDVKAIGTTYEEAKRVYDRILREKVGKGYQIAEGTANSNAAISVGLPATKEHSGHTPELLTPIEEPEALQLAQDVSWWFQQKFDGRRLAVQKTDGKYSEINKLGQIVPIDSRLAEILDLVQAEGFLADGEITDSHFYIWDLLSVNETDLRVQPYEIRYVHLTRLFRGVHETLRVCQTAMTPKDKRAFVKAMHDVNAEEFVCKNRSKGPFGRRRPTIPLSQRDLLCDEKPLSRHFHQWLKFVYRSLGIRHAFSTEGPGCQKCQFLPIETHSFLFLESSFR